MCPLFPCPHPLLPGCQAEFLSLQCRYGNWGYLPQEAGQAKGRNWDVTSEKEKSHASGPIPNERRTWLASRALGGILKLMVPEIPAEIESRD